MRSEDHHRHERGDMGFPPKRRGPRKKTPPSEVPADSRPATTIRDRYWDLVEVTIRLRVRDCTAHEAVLTARSSRPEVVRSTISDAIQNCLWVSESLLRPASSIDFIEILS